MGNHQNCSIDFRKVKQEMLEQTINGVVDEDEQSPSSVDGDIDETIAMWLEGTAAMGDQEESCDPFKFETVSIEGEIMNNICVLLL